MNKDLLNQLPDDDRPAASKLDSLVQDLHISPAFQSELEKKLMDSADKKTQSARRNGTRLLPALMWTALAIGAMLLLNWTIRSLASGSPAAGATPVPTVSFETSVRQGDLCAGPLAAGHGFAVFLTNEDMTGFLPLDEEKTIGEMRSFTWSPDGKLLAIAGNTTGRGNIHILNLADGEIRYVLSGPGPGYIMDAAWSRDGKQFVLWSTQNNQKAYLLNADGTGLVEKQLDAQILGAPQFTPQGKSIVFFGADQNATGLFELALDSSDAVLINSSVEDAGGFAYSPDGSRLAYIEYDRDEGEGRLFTADLNTGERTRLGTWPIPRNPGSSLPEAANLSWSEDGKFLAFDLGRYASDRVIYLAPADGSGLIKVVEPGYAPAISADGRCLAYINDKQVFLLDLAGLASGSVMAEPLLLADLPAGRAVSDYKLDRLQWRP